MHISRTKTNHTWAKQSKTKYKNSAKLFTLIFSAIISGSSQIDSIKKTWVQEQNKQFRLLNRGEKNIYKYALKKEKSLHFFSYVRKVPDCLMWSSRKVMVGIERQERRSLHPKATKSCHLNPTGRNSRKSFRQEKHWPHIFHCLLNLWFNLLKNVWKPPFQLKGFHLLSFRGAGWEQLTKVKNSAASSSLQSLLRTKNNGSLSLFV